MDENDLFEMCGGVEGIKKDPKLLKQWILTALEAYGKEPKFPVGMPMPMPEGIRVTDEELYGSGWMILAEDGPLPDGRTGQSVIKMGNV